MDFATRAYNHSFPFDPIVRSLLDTDFYKLLMMQFIWERYPNERVCWKVTNRTKTVRLADEINIHDLRRQLEHVRTLRFTHSEIIWLRGQTFYGKLGIFKEGFLHTLEHFHLPEFKLDRAKDRFGHITGQFDLTFEGTWWETTLWEIYALTVINEMRSRAMLCKMNRSQLDITYARAKVKLYRKLELLRGVDGLNLSDFGTRRRHSFLWQEHCVLTAKEVIGAGFTGTSNVYLAMKHDLEAKGTNAHELPMAFAAMARKNKPGDEEALRCSQYEVLKQWQNSYHQNLLVFLPDTFGTTQFLKGAPQWISNWTGARPDSKDAYTAGEELITFWNHQGLTPDEVAKKLIIFSDGLDVEVDGHANGTDIVKLHEHFKGRAAVGFGWGTNLTNDFIDCCPFDGNLLRSISIVCKLESVDGHPAIKLSDNYEKAMGPEDEVTVYREAFGAEGMNNAPVLV
jgi:nicotinate phosphoribosyltransferase